MIKNKPQNKRRREELARYEYCTATVTATATAQHTFAKSRRRRSDRVQFIPYRSAALAARFVLLGLFIFLLFFSQDFIPLY